MMSVINKSRLTNVVHSLEIPVDEDKFRAWALQPLHKRPMVQDHFPELSPEHREFLLTGITPDEWDAFFNHD